MWLSDDGLKEIGCTASVAEVLEQMEDGRMNILVRGGTPFRLLERQEHHAYPAGTVELLGRRASRSEPEEMGGEARERYADLLESLTEERPERLRAGRAVRLRDGGHGGHRPEVKQGLLELRSEGPAAAAGAPVQGRHQERCSARARWPTARRGNGKVEVV